MENKIPCPRTIFDIKNVLGVKNRNMVNTIIVDIIKNSYDKNYIELSPDIFKAIVNLKKFNYENIYNKALSSEEVAKLKEVFNKLFDYYKKALTNKDESEKIYNHYYLQMNKEYQSNSVNRIVIDYIAGMTDEFLIQEYNRIKNS